jgi:hypothetical protein
MTDIDHIPLGWICPRCGHVWAPDVRGCTCEPEDSSGGGPQNDKQGGETQGGETPPLRPPGWYETMTLDVSGAEVR